MFIFDTFYDNQDNVDKVKKDLNETYQWSVDWLMLITMDRCKVLHLSNNNKNMNITQKEENWNHYVKNGILVFWWTVV